MTVDMITSAVRLMIFWLIESVVASWIECQIKEYNLETIQTSASLEPLFKHEINENNSSGVSASHIDSKEEEADSKTNKWDRGMS